MSPRGQSLVVVLIAALAGAAGLWLGSRTTPPVATAGSAAIDQDASRLGIGDEAPLLRLPDRVGRVRALSEWRGRPVLINFWASWCGPCVEEMPLLNDFARQESANGVQVVGIALDEPAAVNRYLHAAPVSYPILLDRVGGNDSSVQLGNGLGVLPYSVLLDASGRVLAQKLGPFRDDELSNWVNVAR